MIKTFASNATAALIAAALTSSSVYSMAPQPQDTYIESATKITLIGTACICSWGLSRITASSLGADREVIFAGLAGGGMTFIYPEPFKISLISGVIGGILGGWNLPFQQKSKVTTI